MTSLYLAELMQRAPAREFHVTLVDPAADALAQAATCMVGMSTRCKTACLHTTAESLVQTMEAKYHIITALWLFYHIPPELIGDLVRMLEPHGLLVITMGSPPHPIKSYGNLEQLSRHGDSRPVEQFLMTAQAQGLLTFERCAISTQIDLEGLWESGRGVTEVGKAFFSFLFNRDFEHFPLDAHRELDTLLDGIRRDQASVVSHDHFLYTVRPSNEYRLTTDAK
jgi:hypothetical protein